MSAKNRDAHNRWRSRTVAFRVSPGEANLLDTYVKLSGLTKQDYITKRLLNQAVVVQGNPKVYKALRDRMGEILEALKQSESKTELNDDLLCTIQMIGRIMDGMKTESDYAG